MANFTAANTAALWYTTAAMTGFTSMAPPASKVMVINASATLNNKMPMDTASRCESCQSSEWKGPSVSRREGRRRRGLKLP